MPRTRPPYSPEFRQEAVRLLRSGARSPKQLAAELGRSPQTPTNWLRRDRADRGERQDVLSSDERQRLRDLERENKVLRQEREILKRAAVPSTRQRNIESVIELEVLRWRGGGGTTRCRSAGSCGSVGSGASRSARSAGHSIERPAPFIAPRSWNPDAPRPVQPAGKAETPSRRRLLLGQQGSFGYAGYVSEEELAEEVWGSQTGDGE
jgi:transposase